MLKYLINIFTRKKIPVVMQSRWRLVYDDSAGWVDMCPECKNFGNGETFCPHCSVKLIEKVEPT